jgi:hypothetical protein
MKKLLFLAVVCFNLINTGGAQNPKTNPKDYAVVVTDKSLSNAPMTKAALKTEIRKDKKSGEMANPAKIAHRKELKMLRGNEVRYKSSEAFAIKYPNIKPISTEKVDNLDKINYTLYGKNLSDFYDENSRFVGTVEVKSYMDLPEKSREFISKKYPGYIPTNIIYLDKNESSENGLVLYNNDMDRDSYYVEMSKGNKKIVLQVQADGYVNKFTRMYK